MICFPNAKINIGLNIIEKRSDGYHNIETLFFPIALCDVLEIIENKDSNKPYLWSSTGIEIDASPEDNLCIKALNLLKNDFEIPPVKIHLHKVIPFGAGLGGGSSDAAFTLTTLNKMFDLNLSNEQLIQYASKLGADCAFFIHNTPCTATGIGDILTPFTIDLSGYHLLLIKPDVHVSTPEAYKGINPKSQSEFIANKLSYPVQEWSNLITNDFEETVFPYHPSIKNIKETMFKNGALYASMTGSGAAVFGIFNEAVSLAIENSFIWTEQL